MFRIEKEVRETNCHVQGYIKDFLYITVYGQKNFIMHFNILILDYDVINIRHLGVQKCISHKK